MITIKYGRDQSFLLPREDAKQFELFNGMISDIEVKEVPIPREIPCKAETLHNIVHLLHFPKELEKLPKQELFDVIMLCNYLDCRTVLIRAAAHTIRKLNRMDMKEMRKFFNLQ
jgi:hypothetical protein